MGESDRMKEARMKYVGRLQQYEIASQVLLPWHDPFGVALQYLQQQATEEAAEFVRVSIQERAVRPDDAVALDPKSASMVYIEAHKWREMVAALLKADEFLPRYGSCCDGGGSHPGQHWPECPIGRALTSAGFPDAASRDAGARAVEGRGEVGCRFS